MKRMEEYDTELEQWEAHERQTTWRLLILILVCCVVLLSILMSGCTAAGFQSEAARVAAAKGCYCAAEKCDRVVSAVGVAATVAAEKEAVKQIEVKR